MTRVRACVCVCASVCRTAWLTEKRGRERNKEREKVPIVDFHQLAAAASFFYFLFGTVSKAVFHALSCPHFPPLSLQQRYWDS